MLAVILWVILAIIIIVWLFGLIVDLAGGLINLLLIIAAIILIYNLVTATRART